MGASWLSQKLLLIFLGWAIGLAIVGFFSLSLISFSDQSTRYINDPPFYRWDSNWYISIADGGYSFDSNKNSNVAFFPGYPMLIRLGHFFTGIRMSWVGFFLSIGFSFLSVALLYRLFLLDYSKKESERMILIWLLYPFSFYLISVYSESLFIFLTVLSLYLARRNKFGKASIAAAAAALVRPYGILILPVLIWEYFLQKKESGMIAWHDLNRLILPPVVAFLGFVAFNAIKFQRPFAFIETQKSWGRNLSSPFPVIKAYIYQVFQPSIFLIENLHFLVNLAAVFCACVIIALSVRKIRSSYLFLSILLFLPTLGSGTLTSAHRYAIMAFPLFIVPALWLQKNKYLFSGFLITSSLMLAFFASLFVRWAPIF